jgi:hypothetical protein
MLSLPLELYHYNGRIVSSPGLKLLIRRNESQEIMMIEVRDNEEGLCKVVYFELVRIGYHPQGKFFILRQQPGTIPSIFIIIFRNEADFDTFLHLKIHEKDVPVVQVDDEKYQRWMGKLSGVRQDGSSWSLKQQQQIATSQASIP